MKKQILTIAAINALAAGQNGEERHSLIGGRGGRRCVIVLRDGETLGSLNVKVGTQVVAQERVITTASGEEATGWYYIGNFNVNEELANDYDFQLELAKTKQLANAKAKANPALKQLFSELPAATGEDKA